MAYRDLTAQYLKLRQQHYPPATHYASPTADDDDDLQYTSGRIDEDPFLKGSGSGGSQKQDSPGNGGGASAYLDKYQSKHAIWQAVVDDVRGNMRRIEGKMKDLRKLHQEHMTPRFGKDFAEEERNIELLTEDIKTLFQRNKSTIEKIKVNPDRIHNQEELMLKNIKMSLITELTDVSKTFRDDQRDYLAKMKTFKERSRELRPMSSDQDEMDPEERERIAELEQKIYDPGFTEDQVAELIRNEQDILRRDKEIREILKSIIELQELFQEFGQMVVEQGTLLDRIDHNIDSTQNFVKDANKNLVVAEKYQKSGGMVLCIIFLVIAVIVLVVLFGGSLVLKFMTSGGLLGLLGLR